MWQLFTFLLCSKILQKKVQRTVRHFTLCSPPLLRDPLTYQQYWEVEELVFDQIEELWLVNKAIPRREI